MSDLGQLEDQLHPLMLAALDGDAIAYRTLLAVLTRHLRNYYARRLGASQSAQADDLVQDTLLAIHSRRVTYDRDQPFTAWAYAIARYKLIDHFRSRGRRIQVPLDEEDGLFAADDSDALTARMDVDALLDTVPAGQRRLIRQVKLEGRSIAEVSESSGLSESAVKVSIHRGLKALAARFTGGRADE